jgi:aspartate racemase
MKTIGLVGGVSWESSKEYYRIINEEVARRLGGLHSAECVMTSLDFDPVAKAINAGDHEAYRQLVLRSAARLKGSGVDFALICSNTTNAFAEDVEQLLGVPVIHIADAMGKAVTEKGFRTVGLLGTRSLMEADTVKGRLERKWGLSVIIPDVEDRVTVNRVIFEELCAGKILDSSRKEYLEIMDRLKGRGAEGILLACTEIPLLIQQEHTEIPVFDSTELHALMAVDLALEA